MRFIKAVLAGVCLTLSFSVAGQGVPVPDGMAPDDSSMTAPSTASDDSSMDATADSSSRSTNDATTSMTMQTQTLAPLAPITVPDQSVVTLAGDLPTHDATVGTLAGTANVSGGAASYEIPIALPPGRNGMQPNVSLTYSSRGGNGIAGMGWSLSALSSVHRCPQTVEQDGQTIAVKFTSTDRLCLDGQRLVATSGSYGYSGTVYKTEIDSFARITQLGGDLVSAATYFKVELKSGETVYYGGSTTSPNAARVIPGGLTIPESWLIERRLDRLNNNVIYTYQNFGNAEVLPWRSTTPASPPPKAIAAFNSPMRRAPPPAAPTINRLRISPAV